MFNRLNSILDFLFPASKVPKRKWVVTILDPAFNDCVYYTYDRLELCSITIEPLVFTTTTGMMVILHKDVKWVAETIGD